MKAKTKRCKQCKEKHAADEFGKFDMYKPPSSLGFFCNTDCAADWTKENPVKLQQMYKREYNKETKELKAKVLPNDTKKQHEATQKAFNKMRKLQELMWFKLKGKKPFCISCLKEDMDWCCGHFKTVGSSGHLRYDEKNTYLQCNRYCNMGLSGNIAGNKNTVGYKEGLKIRFGEAKAKEINDYCEKVVIKKWTGLELIEMRKKFNAEIRKLESLLNQED